MVPIVPEVMNFAIDPFLHSFSAMRFGQAGLLLFDPLRTEMDAHVAQLGVGRFPHTFMLNWLVVRNILYFSMYWECHNPN